MKKILIIEDDAILAQVLHDAFRNQGYEVLIARDGEQGLLFLEQEHPEAVVLDIILPKVDGPEVLHILKKSKQFHDTPTIVISNSGRPVDVNSLKKDGASEFMLLDSFNVRPVVEAVASIV